MSSSTATRRLQRRVTAMAMARRTVCLAGGAMEGACLELAGIFTPPRISFSGHGPSPKPRLPIPPASTFVGLEAAARSWRSHTLRALGHGEHHSFALPQKTWISSNPRSPRYPRVLHSPTPSATASTSTSPSGRCTMGPDEYARHAAENAIRDERLTRARKTTPSAASSALTSTRTDHASRSRRTHCASSARCDIPAS